MAALQKRSVPVLCLIILCIILPACGPSPEELAATSAAETAAAATSTFTITPTITLTPTVTPTTTRTPKPPTPTLEPLPGAIPEGYIVTWAKSFSGRCKILGQTELSPGEYSFVLQLENPRSGSWEDLGHLTLSYLIDGNTTQDLLDHPNVKNGTWWGQAFDLLVNAKASNGWHNDLRAEKYYTYNLTEGEIVVLRWTQNPHFFWYCGTIFVK